MLKALKAQLEDAGYIVVDTALKRLEIDPEIRRALDAQRSSSAVASLLHAYPDLFIYSRTLKPIHGCVFGVVCSSEEPLDPARKAILEKHFPASRTAVFMCKGEKVGAFWC